MKVKFSLVAAFLICASTCFGQSIFKPLPLVVNKPKASAFAKGILLPTDSFPSISDGKFQGFRFSGPDVAFAIPDFSMYTGVGIDYVWATANTSTGKWEYNYTLGPRVYGGANLSQPGTVKAIAGVGVRATFFKGWLAIGAIYNLTSKKAQATIGNPAALIPGLN